MMISIIVKGMITCERIIESLVETGLVFTLFYHSHIILSGRLVYDDQYITRTNVKQKSRYSRISR